jgi:hypothetical protein
MSTCLNRFSVSPIGNSVGVGPPGETPELTLSLVSRRSNPPSTIIDLKISFQSTGGEGVQHLYDYHTITHISAL